MRSLTIPRLAAISAVTVIAGGAVSPAVAPAATKRVLVKHFSGDGGKTLRPFTLKRSATLRWTATGGLFSIFDSIDKLGSPNAGVPVNSQASHGSTFLKSGRHAFQINAVGHWTIRITYP